MFRWPSIALILLSAALCFTASAQQQAAPAAAPAAKSNDSDLVVVRISGEPITEKQVLANIESLSTQALLKPEEQKNRNVLLFKGAMENIVTITVLKLEARRRNLTVDQAMIDQQIQQFASRYPSKEEFQKALASQNVTEAGLRKTVEDNLNMQQVVDQAVKDVPPATDEEIQKFYDANPEKFPLPERAHIASIFLKAAPASTPDEKAEIKKKLEDIRADIESKKMTFAEAAAKFSQDATYAQNGGDLGIVSRGQMGKEVEESVFGTIPGSLTPVVKSETGYLLVKVIELKPAGKAPLEEAKPAIKNYLTQVAKQAALQRFMKDLKSKAVIEPFMTAEEFGKRHPVQ
jgi:parvulin-like peptidyl-prolyl isomerase